MERAYAKFHSRGLDILGVSIDQANFAQQVEAYTHNNNMNWPEIYDGKMWDATLAQLYFMRLDPRRRYYRKDCSRQG
jgi:alkyl hydroperoxide reductase subunit AhpC